jgi:hypothetical protein
MLGIRFPYVNYCFRGAVMVLIGNFVKRVNRDTTIDLICMHCFQTAAKGTTDAEAQAIAEQHACNPLGLEEVRHTDPSAGRKQPFLGSL